MASLGTDAVVVISRDLTQELDRFNVQNNGIDANDGIAHIPGSDNFLVHSGAMPMVAILRVPV